MFSNRMPRYEILSADAMDHLDRAVAAGTRIAYAADSTLGHLQVVREP